MRWKVLPLLNHVCHHLMCGIFGMKVMTAACAFYPHKSFILSSLLIIFLIQILPLVFCVPLVCYLSIIIWLQRPTFLMDTIKV